MESLITQKITNVYKYFMEVNKFEVPLYQRDIVWGEAQIKPVFESIMSDWNDGKISYLGNILVNTKNKNYELVDGQQRTTFIYFTLLNLYKIAEEEYTKYKTSLIYLKPDYENIKDRNIVYLERVKYFKELLQDKKILNKDGFKFENTCFEFNEFEYLISKPKFFRKIFDLTKEKIFSPEVINLINHKSSRINIENEGKYFRELREKINLLEKMLVMTGQHNEMEPKLKYSNKFNQNNIENIIYDTFYVGEKFMDGYNLNGERISAQNKSSKIYKNSQYIREKILHEISTFMENKFEQADRYDRKYTTVKRIMNNCNYRNTDAYFENVSEFIELNEYFVEVLNKVIDNTIENIEFIVIEIKNEEATTEIFERVNSNGKPLEEWDLIKNFIFKRMNKYKLDKNFIKDKMDYLNNKTSDTIKNKSNYISKYLIFSYIIYTLGYKPEGGNRNLRDFRKIFDLKFEKNKNEIKVNDEHINEFETNKKAMKNTINEFMNFFEKINQILDVDEDKEGFWKNKKGIWDSRFVLKFMIQVNLKQFIPYFIATIYKYCEEEHDFDLLNSFSNKILHILFTKQTIEGISAFRIRDFLNSIYGNVEKVEKINKELNDISPKWKDIYDMNSDLNNADLTRKLVNRDSNGNDFDLNINLNFEEFKNKTSNKIIEALSMIFIVKNSKSSILFGSDSGIYSKKILLKKMQVEHIAPKNPKKQDKEKWEKLIANYEETIELIGNKISIDGKLNSAVSNMYFSDKKDIFFPRALSEDEERTFIEFKSKVLDYKGAQLDSTLEEVNLSSEKIKDILMLTNPVQKLNKDFSKIKIKEMQNILNEKIIYIPNIEQMDIKTIIDATEWNKEKILNRTKNIYNNYKNLVKEILVNNNEI